MIVERWFWLAAVFQLTFVLAQIFGPKVLGALVNGRLT